jgi:hypothetical protein
MLKTQKEIKSDNKKFKKLSKPQQRVAIAKDVIAQINMKRIFAKTLVYLTPNSTQRNPHTGSAILEEAEVGTELREIFKEKVETCHCCAKGALFLTAVERYNECPVTNSMRENLGMRFADQDIHGQLSKFFSPNQLILIEAAFEGYNGYTAASRHSDEVAFIKEGGRYSNILTTKLPDHNDRLLYIMKNIVRNKGTLILKASDFTKEELNGE